ncbi:hypothetical protein PLICRDRAFT_99876 [Plicaturopsis crispa FD-325 SS-3]|nr:hypothetical protein PLICRDRAFT_99876 [Plicaturopsis crispa FD-325 SS-3]
MVLDERRPSLVLFAPQLLAAETLLAFLVAVYPSKALRVLGFALYAAINLRATTYTTGNAMLDYTLGSAFANNIFTAVHFLWLSDPQKTLCHRNDTVHPSKRGVVWRMYLAICAKGSVRGVGWAGQVPSLPAAPTCARAPFVAGRLRAAVAYYLLADVCQAYLRANPAFTSSIAAQGMLFRCVNILAYAGLPYALLGLTYASIGAASVAVGLSEPRDWPSFFGNWADAYTVRYFWGCAPCLSILRRFTASMGKATSRALAFPPRTIPSALTQLYVAFAVSALLHTAGDAMVGRAYTGRSLPFFLAQAGAITLEAVVAWAWAVIVGGAGPKRDATGPKRWHRAVGYVWVCAWFAYTAPSFAWPVSAGLGPPDLIPARASVVSWGLDAAGVDLKALFPPLNTQK